MILAPEEADGRLLTAPGEVLAMGARIASEDGGIRVSVRVGGQFSSTRSELVAIAIALRSMEQTQTLVILVDSATALQRLAWRRSSDFCPSPRKIKDVDVMHDIMTLIRARQDAGRLQPLLKSMAILAILSTCGPS